MTPRPFLSLVIPARNEAELIEETLRTVSAYLEGIGRSWEIVVGDSASTDGTGELVRRSSIPGIRVIRVDDPGKGLVLTRCLAEARGTVVGFLDADLEIPVDMVGSLLERIGSGADVAIASKTPQSDRNRPLRRRVATRLLNRGIRALFGSSLTDHQAGCKLFRAGVLRPTLSRVSTTGWLWDTEVLVRLLRAGARVDEVAFTPTPARTNRLGGSDAVSAFRELLRIRLLTLAPRRAHGPAAVRPPVEVPPVRG